MFAQHPAPVHSALTLVMGMGTLFSTVRKSGYPTYWVSPSLSPETNLMVYSPGWVVGDCEVEVDPSEDVVDSPDEVVVDPPDVVVVVPSDTVVVDPPDVVDPSAVVVETDNDVVVVPAAVVVELPAEVVVLVDTVGPDVVVVVVVVVVVISSL